MASWFKYGAPAGINTEFSDASRIWAPTDDEEVIDPETLYEDPAHHDANPVIDNDEDVGASVDKYENKGWVRIFKSHRKLKRTVGKDYVLSDIITIQKKRFDPVGKKWAIKKRTVLNLAASGITAASRLPWKTQLTRATDAGADTLDCIYDLLPEEDDEFLVIDAEDEFGALPIVPEELT